MGRKSMSNQSTSALSAVIIKLPFSSILRSTRSGKLVFSNHTLGRFSSLFVPFFITFFVDSKTSIKIKPEGKFKYNIKVASNIA